MAPSSRENTRKILFFNFVFKLNILIFRLLFFKLFRFPEFQDLSIVFIFYYLYYIFPRLPIDG